jgi:pimeloyl-ACP methyl ester carboxylesterase
VRRKAYRLLILRDVNIYQPQIPQRTRQHLIRGVNYEVSEWGRDSNPLLVYLHGWGDCSTTFQFVVDQLRDDWFVVAPDWRGFGGSSVDAEAFWFPDYLADLDQMLAIYSPDRPVRLVGHSMGANIGGLFAGAMPERVAAFVNIEGFGLTDSDPADAPRRYRRWIEESRAAPLFSNYENFTALARRVHRRSPRASEAICEFVARAWAEKCDGRVHLRANPRHKLANAVLYRRGESEACWRQVSAPVMLIAGGESEFANPSDPRLGTGIHDLPFRAATVETIPDAGHMMHFEAPAALAGLIEAFFAKHL